MTACVSRIARREQPRKLGRLAGMIVYLAHGASGNADEHAPPRRGPAPARHRRAGGQPARRQSRDGRRPPIASRSTDLASDDHRRPFVRRPSGQPSGRRGAAARPRPAQLSAASARASPSGNRASSTGRGSTARSCSCRASPTRSRASTCLRQAISTLKHAELVTYPRVGHGLKPVLDDALDRVARFVTRLD